MQKECRCSKLKDNIPCQSRQCTAWLYRLIHYEWQQFSKVFMTIWEIWESNTPLIWSDPCFTHKSDLWCWEKIKSFGQCVRRNVSVKLAFLVNIHTWPLELFCIDFLSLEPGSRSTKGILVITDHFRNELIFGSYTYWRLKSFYSCQMFVGAFSCAIIVFEKVARLELRVLLSFNHFSW